MQRPVALIPMISSIWVTTCRSADGRSILFEYRQHLQAPLYRGVAVGDTLRLDTWAASTTSSAPSHAASERDTVREIDAPGVDEIQW